MVRLGIVGTGRIAKRFVTDAWQKLDVEITAVYNPHDGSAQKFCDEMKLEKCACTDWDDFVNAIDAAYVASPLYSHYSYVERLLESGVHVLCEKPMVVSAEQAEKAFLLAKEKNCILMEGIKTAYSPGFIKLLELIDSEKIGDIKDVEACFTKLVKPGLREWTHTEDCGSMTELGTYGCFAVTKLLGNDYTDVRYFSIRNEAGVDSFTKVYFEYGGEAAGMVKAGIGVKSEGELIISGTNGYVLVRAPWWMPKRIEVHYEDACKTEIYDCDYIGNGLQYELEHFLEKIKGTAMNDIVTSEQSIRMADIMEKFLKREKTYRNN